MENALKSDPLVYQFIIVIIIDFEYCQVYHVTIRQHILGLARGPVMMNWCLMSSDVMRHIRDKLWPMPKHGAINLYVHGNQKAR